MNQPQNSAGGISDAELIKAVRTGSPTAFGQLYQRHYERAVSVARWRLNSLSDVEDVVSNSFMLMLDLLKRGKGPDECFGAYLSTIVSRQSIRVNRGSLRVHRTDDIALFLEPEEFSDPILEKFESKTVIEAYRSLPERWQAILWHLEVEKKKPAEIGPDFGLSANAVSALAVRAREGLRISYVQMHVSQGDSRCDSSQLLGSYIRGNLSPRQKSKLQMHFTECNPCAMASVQLQDVGLAVRSVIAPLFLGIGGAQWSFEALGLAIPDTLSNWSPQPAKRRSSIATAATATAVSVAVAAVALTALAGFASSTYERQSQEAWAQTEVTDMSWGAAPLDGAPGEETMPRGASVDGVVAVYSAQHAPVLHDDLGEGTESTTVTQAAISPAAQERVPQHVPPVPEDGRPSNTAPLDPVTAWPIEKPADPAELSPTEPMPPADSEESLAPIEPIEPDTPSEPPLAEPPESLPPAEQIEPSEPVEPTDPMPPVDQDVPTDPSEPPLAEPTDPMPPTEPDEPQVPIEPTEPPLAEPTEPDEPSEDPPPSGCDSGWRHHHWPSDWFHQCC